MLDIFLETLRALVIGILLIYIMRFAARNHSGDAFAKRLVLAGIALILFASILDVTDNFDALSPLVVVGNTPVQAILEKLVGSLGGFVLLTLGLMRWLPRVQSAFDDAETLEESETALERTRQQMTRAIEGNAEALEQSNRRVQESEARLRAFIQNIPAEIVIKDVQRRYLLVNRTFEENNGLSEADAIGRTVHDLFPDWIADPINAHDRGVLETGQVDMHELPGMVGATDRVYGRLTFPIVDCNGTTLGLGTMTSDITEKKHNEVVLRASEERYRELFEESPIPFMEEDWSGLLHRMHALQLPPGETLEAYFDRNPAFVHDLYDLTSSYGVSNSMLRLYRAPSKEEFLASLKHDHADAEEIHGFGRAVIAFFRGATAYQYDARETALDGLPIATRIKFSLPPGFASTWKRVLVSIEDVTERHEVETKLRNAQKMEAIGQLTGGVAHDFNNLLAVIQGCSELLSPKGDNDAEMVEGILRATRRGAELTSRLLAYARQHPLETAPFSVGELVMGMEDMLSRVLGETIMVETRIPGDLWRALADAGQLEDALLNLAINSRDAMPAGGRLRITCANAHLDEAACAALDEVRPGAYVRLEVADTGSGMSQGVAARAFEPFYSTKEVGRGSGLGLSMVYGFVKQSGGHITVDSTEGQGTKVCLYLPKSDAAPDADKPLATPPAAPGNGQRILLIEDDAQVRALVVRTLRTLGYHPIETEHAAEARQLVEAGADFDMLLSDVVLPGGTSGPGFARELLALRPDARILFMSGYAAEAPEIEDTGAQLLGKPFTRAQLARAVQDTLNAGGERTG